MDELAQARVELSLLEKQERELVKALCDVRHAAEAQRTKIKELVEQLPAPIDRLPNELFLLIIDLAIHATLDDPRFYNWKTDELMRVSRHWRNTILHCPILWNTIVIAPSSNALQLKAHVERSWPSLVNIKIDDPWSYLGIIDLFDVTASCADRWRSLSISVNPENIRLALFRSIRHLMLPSLVRVSMEVPAFLDGKSVNPQFLTPGNSPFLEYLEISGDFMFSGLPILSSLKELRIHLPSHASSTSSAFLEQLSLYPRLSTLTISGDDQTLKRLRPNCIRLLSLVKLICTVSNANYLLHAIVAPTLTHFEYTIKEYGKTDGDILFAGLDSKFTSVRHLVLNTHLWQFKKFVWSAFPNLRHVELNRSDADIVFQSNFPSIAWQHLECLYINGGRDLYGTDGVHSDGPPFFLDGLVNWLQQRRGTGESRLRIKIFSFSGDVNGISKIHDALHGLSVLEWGDYIFNVSIEISGTSTTPWLVCDYLYTVSC